MSFLNKIIHTELTMLCLRIKIEVKNQEKLRVH